MKVISFITDFQVVDRIIDHLKLTFVPEKPPPSHVFEQVALMAAASACTSWKRVSGSMSAAEENVDCS
jgi:hypothetical protein